MPQLVYRFLQKWVDTYKQEAAGSQLRRYTIYHVVKSLYEFFNDAQISEYHYDDLFLQLRASNKKNAALKRKTRELGKECTSLRNQNDKLSDHVASLEREIAHLNRANASLQKKVDRMQFNISKMRESKSWKITAPLRAIRRKLK